MNVAAAQRGIYGRRDPLTSLEGKCEVKRANLSILKNISLIRFK